MKSEWRFLTYPPSAGKNPSGKGALLLHPTRPRWFMANDTAVEIAEKLSHGTSVETIVDELSALYPHVSRDQLSLDVESVQKECARLLQEDTETHEQIRHPELHVVYIHLTGRCNLRCPQCYSFRPSVMDLPYSVVENVVDQLRGTGARLTLTGGEPFLYPDIKVLLRHIGRSIPIKLLTNGTLIDREWAGFLASEVDASIQISIDGSREEIHDAVRGSGAFASTLRAIEVLRENGLIEKITFATTMISKNWSDLEDIIGLAEKMGVRRVRFIPVRRVGRAKENWDWLGRGTEDDFYEAFFDKFLGRDAENVFGVEVSCGLSGLVVKMPDSQPDDFWCPVGHQLVVDVDGKVYPCTLLMGNRFVLGNVFHQKLSEIISSQPMIEICTTLVERKTHIEKCAACLWRNLCQGGCMAEAWDTHGTFWAPSSFCDYRTRQYAKIFDVLLDNFSKS